ncbi:UNVERIFIED_CONTAM: hypothetical protein NCL1_41268 [Trichonephila clavipes]
MPAILCGYIFLLFLLKWNLTIEEKGIYVSASPQQNLRYQKKKDSYVFYMKKKRKKSVKFLLKKCHIGCGYKNTDGMEGNVGTCVLSHPNVSIQNNSPRINI